ncbi:MAG TPA: ABC transporter substrate-binding protein [Candidatus Eisenbacteria bacterium]|nr:ABC transporter substrate-binding protein [Candidatus Eisenbacteria bacterium]
MKRIIALLLVAILAIGLVACGSNNEKADEPAADEVYIPVVALGYGHQFWQAVKQGADEAAADYGVTITFEGPEEETMVDKQVDMIKTALAKNPVAIAVAAIDIEAVRSDIEAAKDKGVKVVGFDAGVGDLAEATAATDSYSAGALAAEHAARLLDNEGKVGIVGHSQTVVDAVARVDGFKETVEKDYPGLEIVDIQYGDGDHLKSAEVAKGMMQANPDIDLIYTSNEGACVGTYNGLKEAGLIGEVMIVGFDSSAALKEAIRNGEIAGAITQDPVKMGYLTVESAYKLYKGEEVDEIIDTGAAWYDADNMDDPDIAPLLYD